MTSALILLVFGVAFGYFARPWIDKQIEKHRPKGDE